MPHELMHAGVGGVTSGQVMMWVSHLPAMPVGLVGPQTLAVQIGGGVLPPMQPPGGHCPVWANAGSRHSKNNASPIIDRFILQLLDDDLAGTAGA
jgi:hypothetical protein